METPGDTLHPRLAADCYRLGWMGGDRVLLMDNGALPWLILVPAGGAGDWCELEPPRRHAVLDAACTLGTFLRTRPGVTRLNVATIGNLVPQLHVHVVGRGPEDPYWPGVVWGQAATRPYPPDAAASLCEGLRTCVGSAFEPAFAAPGQHG